MSIQTKEAGFSLVELVVTMAIIGILAGIIAVRYITLKESASASACKANQMALDQAQRFYYVEKATTGIAGYTSNLDSLLPYIFNNSIPDCPEAGLYSIQPDFKITCSRADHSRN